MLRDRRAYDGVLNSYSSAIAPFNRFALDGEGRMKVQNKTAHLYRYWDASAFAEYLYSCVTHCGNGEDCRHADRRASLLVRLIIQNKGKLSQSKRKMFPKITNKELARIETAVDLASEQRTEDA